MFYEQSLIQQVIIFINKKCKYFICTNNKDCSNV